jgi:hypothetical protein
MADTAVPTANLMTQVQVTRKDYDAAVLDPEFEQWHFVPARMDESGDARS